MKTSKLLGSWRFLMKKFKIHFYGATGATPSSFLSLFKSIGASLANLFLVGIL